MKLRNKGWLRAMAVGMAAILLLMGLPCSALAASFSAAVSADVMYIYSDAQGSRMIGYLPKKTIVTVSAVEGSVAYITYNGRSGFARVADMVALESFAQRAVAGVNTYVFQKPDIKSARLAVPAGFEMYLLAVNGSVAMVEKNGVVAYAYLPHLIVDGQAMGGQQEQAPVQNATPQQGTRAVAVTNTYVFQKPDIKSARLAIPAGFEMYVLATSGDVAMVQKNGVTAYAYLPHLWLEGQSAPAAPAAPEQPKLPTFADAYQSGKYSNEQLCYLFLTQVMGYNAAATAGVLANINYESGFQTAISGDSGTSYGLCQWHASRKTRLLDYCAQYGVGADALVAQLAYLKYELETFYPLVHHYLQGVSNTAEGAYDAGYFFCYNYEGPANKESQSVKRAQSAQSTFYPRYAQI